MHGRLAAALIAVTCLSIPVRAAGGDVIINEIMYNPPEDRDDLQYLELFNRGRAVADLSRWTLKGAKFVFPDKTEIAPGAWLVVCRDRKAFAGHYGTTITALGDFGGRLKHGGEKIELVDAEGRTVDEVRYSDEEPWPVGPDGYSPSLERICPSIPGGDPCNWAASQMPEIEGAAGTPGRRNDSFSANLPPVVASIDFSTPQPGQAAPVTVEAADDDGVKEVTLLYRRAAPDGQASETAVVMRRVAGDEKKGTYQAEIEGQPEDLLVRFRIRAVDAAGTHRLQPGPNEPRPAYTFSTFSNSNDTAAIPFAHVFSVGQGGGNPEAGSPGAGHPPLPAQPVARVGMPNFRSPESELARGNNAFIFMPPGGGEVLTFDYVDVRPRAGGFKVHFQKDRAFRGMTGINVVADQPPRWALSEWLSYELFRMAGVAAPTTDHIRIWRDGRLLGCHFMFEQINKAFLDRTTGDHTGNLYKLLWYGSGLVGQHEKKTNQSTGHEDLVQLIGGLNRSTGAEQWEYIQKHFNVEQFINYYAVNMCIQNWDGFFNNYFTYHDTELTKKWEIYPWDVDKTWGDYDGASPQYDWYTMPLTYAMKGDRSPGSPSILSRIVLGPFGGASWWRPGGRFGEPLLANAEFRKRFLIRLEEICNTLFTEEKFLPVIDGLEKRLEPEVAVRAEAMGQDAKAALQAFRGHIQSFRNQLEHRREFLLAELEKEKQSRAATEAKGGAGNEVGKPGSGNKELK